MSKKKNTILVVDSDIQSQKMIAKLLNEDDFMLLDCLKGKQVNRLAMSIKPDLILLDIDLPDIQGRDVIMALREWSRTPIIIISARAEDSDIVEALNLGANGYVIKPFNADILLARINASLRSSAVREVGVPELINGSLRVDLVRHEVYLEDTLLSFTPKEYNLLRYFMIHRGRMLRHREILKNVWGEGHCEDRQYLRVFIGQLRDKIEKEPSNPKYIVTETGVGYRMDVEGMVPLHNQGEMNFLAA